MEGACVCDTSPPPILRLRGLCPHSVIDSLFLPMNLDKDISSLVYRGNIHSFIRWVEYIRDERGSIFLLRGGTGDIFFGVGRGRDQNSRGRAFSGRGKQYVNAEVNVLFWFGIFTLQYTLLSIIFCKPLFILAPILRVIFAIPAASSKSEQVFSFAGRVVTLDWNRLAPEMVEVQSATAEKHALCVKNLLALRLILLLLFNIYVLILSSQL